MYTYIGTGTSVSLFLVQFILALTELHSYMKRRHIYKYLRKAKTLKFMFTETLFFSMKITSV